MGSVFDNDQHRFGSRFGELKAGGTLPSPTGVALAILRLAQKEDVTLTEIVHAVQADPALSGKLIKYANASSAGHAPIGSVSDAVRLLGFSAVRQLALGFSVLSQNRRGACKNFDYAGFWSRSLATALVLQALCQRTRAAPPEEAFACGLLSAVGTLALATLYPEEYGALVSEGDEDVSRTKLEQKFATDHLELSAALLEEWGLPQLLIDAVLHQEDPHDAADDFEAEACELGEYLSLAASIAAVFVAQTREIKDLMPGIMYLANKVGIGDDSLMLLCDAAAQSWREWGKILEVPTHQLSPFCEIVASCSTPSVLTADDAIGHPLRILIVENNVQLSSKLANLLVLAGHKVMCANSGAEGLRMMVENIPQLIVTGWNMPEMDGIAFCRALRETEVGQGVYVIILTQNGEEGRIASAFEAGANDYINHADVVHALSSRLLPVQRVIELQEKATCDSEQLRRHTSELALANRRLQRAALTDPLTELPNRRYALERIEQEWSRAVRFQRPLACMMIDIDFFKQINDTYGHQVGDLALCHAGSVFRNTARRSDVICRLGGDEFLLIAPDSDLQAASTCANRLRKAIHAAILSTPTINLQFTVSVGVAAKDPSILFPQQLLKAADQALYASKREGRNTVRIGATGEIATSSKHGLMI